MRNVIYSVLLIMACSCSIGRVKTGFGGTVFVNKDIIRPDDPTAFKRLAGAGEDVRILFDRRVECWTWTRAHVFDAAFDDGQSMEVQVNAEFDSTQALAQAGIYLPVIGQLPFALRKDVRTVVIHDGKYVFGGGNHHLLIHADMGEEYRSSGYLGEVFFHEAAHTSLDADHATNAAWVAVQEKDPSFISEYAKEYFDREDVAETFLLYFALRYRPDRLDAELQEKIVSSVPNRIAYFDGLNLDMHPVKTSRAGKQPARQPGPEKTGPKIKPAPQPEKTPTATTPSKEEKLLEWIPATDTKPPNSRPGSFAKIIFENRTDQLVKFYWIGHEGEIKLYHETLPGGTDIIYNYVGDVWLITDKRDKPLGYFVVETRISRAIIPGRK